MRIEVYEQAAGDKAGREVWVRVLANEAHDWPSIEKMLSPEQKATLNSLGGRKLRYYPMQPVEGEHDYLFDDYFVWEKDQ